jgi:hypothetical protein
MENAQILAPAVPPVSDATSEPDNTTTPSPRQHSVDEMRSERLLKKREREPDMIKTESDDVVEGVVHNMAGVAGSTKENSISTMN